MFVDMLINKIEKDENLFNENLRKVKNILKLKEVNGCYCCVSEDDVLYVDDESNFIIEGELDFFFF